MDNSVNPKIILFGCDGDYLTKVRKEFTGEESFASRRSSKVLLLMKLITKRKFVNLFFISLFQSAIEV